MAPPPLGTSTTSAPRASSGPLFSAGGRAAIALTAGQRRLLVRRAAARVHGRGEPRGPVGGSSQEEIGARSRCYVFGFGVKRVKHTATPATEHRGASPPHRRMFMQTHNVKRSWCEEDVALTTRARGLAPMPLGASSLLTRLARPLFSLHARTMATTLRKPAWSGWPRLSRSGWPFARWLKLKEGSGYETKQAKLRRQGRNKGARLLPFARAHLATTHRCILFAQDAAHRSSRQRSARRPCSRRRGPSRRVPILIV